MTISLSDALLGFQTSVKFLNDEFVTLVRKGITQPGTIWKIPKLGFTDRDPLLLHLQVVLPENIPKNLLDAVQETIEKKSPPKSNLKTYSIEFDVTNEFRS